MKLRWPRIMTGLAFASCLAMLAPACVVRAKGKVRTRAVIVVDDTNPPPPPRYVTVQPRSGYVWVRGHWEYTGARWVWIDGRWEREQAGKRWQPGHWEKRGNQHHWVAGYWVTGSAGGGVVRDHRNKPEPQPTGHVRDHRKPDPQPTGNVRDHRAPPPVLAYPTQAPPPPQAENQAARAGYIWVSGRWDWKAGKWAWTAGHWERAKANHNWVSGRWEHKGDRYVWVQGRWEAAPAGNVRDHRKKDAAPEPPPVKNEKVKAKRP